MFSLKSTLHEFASPVHWVLIFPNLLDTAGWGMVAVFFSCSEAMLSSADLSVPVLLVCTKRTLKLHMLKITCPRIDKRKPNGWLRENTQKAHSSYKIIRITIVSNPMQHAFLDQKLKKNLKITQNWLTVLHTNILHRWWNIYIHDKTCFRLNVRLNNWLI